MVAELDADAGEGKSATTPAPGSPHHGMPQITRMDVLCVGPLVLFSAYNFIGRFFTAPLLHSHPVLLELLRGSIPAMLSAGSSARLGHTPLWQAVLAPLLILVCMDPFLYWSGRRYGRKLVNHLAQTDRVWRRRLAFGERFFKRWGPWTIVFSAFLPASVIFYLAAGEVGMPILLFAAADIAGAMIWIALNVGLGYVFFHQADTVATAIGQYAFRINIGLIVLVVITATWRGYRNQSPDDADPPPMDTSQVS